MIASNTRSQILELAENLIRTRGYNSFSYNDISSKLNVKNAAIHYHFPSKEVLGKAVIEENILRFEAFILANQHRPHTAQLIEFIDIYGQSIAMGQVCIVGAIATEYDGLPNIMRSKVVELTSKISNYLEQLLGQGKLQGVFEFVQSPRQKALMIISNMAASLQLARLMEDNVFEEIRSGILKELSVSNYE